MKREKAIAVGNRAGIVEWANASWSRVTGFALEDAISKPIAELLGMAGIGPDVIDFVQRHFERGEPCEIELPLDPPNGRRRFIHVSVESLRDRHGEVSHFAAIAWDASESVAASARAAAAHREETLRAAPQETFEPAELRLASTDLSVLVREAVLRRADANPYRTTFDLDLPEGLPRVMLDPGRMSDLLETLFSDAVMAIGSEWGTVSVSTGLATNDEIFVSPTYPRDCLLRGLPETHYGFVEVHDTGFPVDRTVVEILAGHGRREGVAGRAGNLARARALLQACRGDLRIDADPGFGTRVILLLPT